ncbi:ABC transporter permease [Paeniglutamicibacter cryotolerans]|uniref:Putative ABC transport system permease protein n=1 Tax=Paeniglutamicibacter cryotolerans TaxID=670079 RepID=A0A839QFB8_9MICC|nr:ABC transporter permease [Paeniglutamicibacter cryotolerans]MBB2994313.1 putative ABC transport system permease protein [Paeniglutamicibacter cryotolerans]
MKFIDTLASAISNTFRSKLRTGLTVVAIFIGAFTLTITSAIGTGISNYIDTQVASIGATDVLSITKTSETTANPDSGPAKYDPEQAKASGAQVPGRPTSVLSAKDLKVIAGTSGIESVEPVVLVSPDYIQYGNHGKFQLSLNPVAGITRADLASGSQLDESGTESQILLPTSYLDSMGLGTAEEAVGKTVRIGITDYAGKQSTVNATVVGVQNETLLGTTAGINQHLINELVAIQNTGRPASLVQGYVMATAHFDPNLGSDHTQGLKDALAAQGYTAQTVQDQLGAFQSVINGIVGVLNAFAVIALIAAGFGIINTLLMSVQERTREIGLMKAMGMGGGRVYTLFSLEAIFIGFLGSAIGAVAAIGLGSLISNILADTVLSGLPGLQVMQFAPASVATIIGVVMLIAFLAGTLPARRAARQNPIDALRYE